MVLFGRDGGDSEWEVGNAWVVEEVGGIVGGVGIVRLLFGTSKGGGKGGWRVIEENMFEGSKVWVWFMEAN